MSTMSHYRPSKRPSVKQVSNWDLLFSESQTNDWRGDGYVGHVEVYNGYPFPDFYKVIWIPINGKKVSKLFYGESAWNDTERFVYDLGFANVLGSL